MKHLFGDDSVKQKTVLEESNDVAKDLSVEQNHIAKKPAWLKQRKVQKKSHNKKGANKKATSIKPITNQSGTNEKVNAAINSMSSQINTLEAQKNDEATEHKEIVEEKASDLSDSEAESDEIDDRDISPDKKDVDDDDTEWEKFQQRLAKRDKILEGRSNVSHDVHCPLFPEIKQEYWWVYICDRKSLTLLTAPAHITSLVHSEEFQLRFAAPRWPHVYTFSVCLRSDSYLGFDQVQDIKLDVKEAPEVPTEHPQWDISDEETADDVDAADEHSEFTTDEDVSDIE